MRLLNRRVQLRSELDLSPRKAQRVEEGITGLEVKCDRFASKPLKGFSGDVGRDTRMPVAISADPRTERDAMTLGNQTLATIFVQGDLQLLGNPRHFIPQDRLDRQASPHFLHHRWSPGADEIGLPQFDDFTTQPPLASVALLRPWIMVELGHQVPDRP